MATAVTEFNKAAAFNSEIQEKLHEIKSLCKKEGIPFFFSACIKNEKGGSEYTSEMLSPEICGVALSKDWISKFCDITLGFDAVPPSSLIEVDADKLFK